MATPKRLGEMGGAAFLCGFVKGAWGEPSPNHEGGLRSYRRLPFDIF